MRVGDFEDVVQVVRDEHDGEALLGEALDERRAPARVCATPSAAVGSSRMTSLEFHCTALATATDCRWPPESEATGCRIERIVVTASDAERLGRALLHARLFQATEPVALLAAEVHVLDDVEVVAEREVLVDDLDPELGRVLRAVDAAPACRRRGSRRCPQPWMPATHLIRVDLPAPLSPTSAITSPRSHLEVDVGERLHRAERLRDPAELEEGCVAHGGAFPTTKDGGGARDGRLHLHVTGRLLAVLLVLADADVAPLQEAVLEEPRVVRLGDRDHRQERPSAPSCCRSCLESVDPGTFLPLSRATAALAAASTSSGTYL